MKFENIGKYNMEFACTCVFLPCNKVLAGINILLVEGKDWQPLLLENFHTESGIFKSLTFVVIFGLGVLIIFVL